MAVDKVSAAKELLLRRQVRRDLTEFCKLNNFDPQRHHQLLIKNLEAVSRGEIDRLLVCMPPGSAKSTYASMLFPAWYLAQQQHKNIIAASHTTELAERFGRRVRNIVTEHGTRLGISLSDDSKAAGRWATKTGGEYFAAGVGVGIAGFRADLAIIDDPIRSRQDADSKLIRDRQWDWWVADLSTRLKPGAAVVLIQTRWHEDDLAGRLLELEPERWTVVSLSMEAVENDPLGRAIGEPLWPEWFTDDMRNTAKRDARTWNALYQQQPAPDEGDFFKREHIRHYKTLPKNLVYYGASDYAVTDGGGDYTEHGLFGVDVDGNIYAVDWWRGQTSADVWIDAKLDMMEKWKPARWFAESGVIRRSIEPFLIKRQREREVYQSVEWIASISDKPTRARSIQGRMAMGMVYFPHGSDWANEIERQLLTFPAAKHDDAVDVMGLIGRGLDGMRNANAIPARKKPLEVGTIEWVYQSTSQAKERSKYRN